MKKKDILLFVVLTTLLTAMLALSGFQGAIIGDEASGGLRFQIGSPWGSGCRDAFGGQIPVSSERVARGVSESVVFGDYVIGVDDLHYWGYQNDGFRRDGFSVYGLTVSKDGSELISREGAFGGDRTYSVPTTGCAGIGSNPVSYYDGDGCPIYEVSGTPHCFVGGSPGVYTVNLADCRYFGAEIIYPVSVEGGLVSTGSDTGIIGSIVTVDEGRLEVRGLNEFWSSENDEPACGVFQLTPKAEGLISTSIVIADDSIIKGSVETATITVSNEWGAFDGILLVGFRQSGAFGGQAGSEKIQRSFVKGENTFEVSLPTGFFGEFEIEAVPQLNTPSWATNDAPQLRFEGVESATAEFVVIPAPEFVELSCNSDSDCVNDLSSDYYCEKDTGFCVIKEVVEKTAFFKEIETVQCQADTDCASPCSGVTTSCVDKLCQYEGQCDKQVVTEVVEVDSGSRVVIPLIIIAIFGIGGTIGIILKMMQLRKPKKRRGKKR